LISKSTIEKVFEISRVEEVIGDFIQLKKSGSNYKGLSPFTNEKTPSFMISPSKQIWKDFSSGKGGNVVAFLMEHEQLSYPQAIKFLASKYNIEVEETAISSEQKEKFDEKEKLMVICEFAKKFFTKQLNDSDFGKNIAFNYLNERGFDKKIINDFEIGCLTTSRNSFKNYAIENGFKEDDLISLGLISSKNKNDIYSSRIIFPIKTISGRTVGFGARVLQSSIKTAKYINSPDSIIYNKSKILYGLYKSKTQIVKNDNCYIVEGYTDVIRFHQKGIPNVVSSSGTALTLGQINIIRRLTKNITMLFDSDNAGLNATIRSIDMILSEGMNVSVCLFPENEDPDSFARNKNSQEIEAYLNENSIDFIEFKAKELYNSKRNSAVEKANVVNDIVSSISKIPDRIKQEIYIKQCSQMLDITENTLFNALAQLNQITRVNSRDYEEKKVSPIKKESKDQIFKLEKKIIEILILYGHEKISFDEIKMIKNENGDIVYKPTKVKSYVHEKIFLDLHSDEVEFANEEFKILYKNLIEEYQKKQSFDAKVFVNSLPKNLSELVTSVLIEDEIYQLHDWRSKNVIVKGKESSISQLVTETILTLRTLLINKKVQELSKLSGDDDKNFNKDTLEEIVNYYQLKSLLSKKLNRVI
jgi:DNA primase